MASTTGQICIENETGSVGSTPKEICNELNQEDFEIQSLGESKFDSPLEAVAYADDSTRVMLSACTGEKSVTLERAGPRKKIYFEPSKTRAAIVTCGGLCPGINNVIRAIVMALYYRYGVQDIVGLMYGYEGLNPKISKQMVLDPEKVKNIHKMGGTILGTSRGPQDPAVMVQFLVDNEIDILFTIGGDGTLKGSAAMVEEINKRGLKISIVGVPKTIDNDILFTERTFGFETAVDCSQAAITSAHTEAVSQDNCIGLVKLMGRDSGFVALYSSVASCDVNLLLLPEVPFSIEKVAEYVEWRLKTRRHCLIVVAEGAGQDVINVGPAQYDSSGNLKFEDVGIWLKKKLAEILTKREVPHQMKYIDPSYMIRAAPANAGDSIFCIQLAQMAVHAALSGKTAMATGLVNGHFVHLPFKKIVERRKKVNSHDLFYQTMLDNSGMPRSLV